LFALLSDSSNEKVDALIDFEVLQVLEVALDAHQEATEADEDITNKHTINFNTHLHLFLSFTFSLLKLVLEDFAVHHVLELVY
jgi:hypothetical protein